MSIPKPDGPDIDIGPPILTTCWILYGIATIIVGARIYTQVRVTRQFGLGDIIMIGAVFIGILHIIILTISHYHGLGRHFFYLNDDQRVKSMEWEFVSEPFGIMCSTLGRSSFIILMFRLFGTTKIRKWFLCFLIAETVVINLMTIITIFVQCGKVETLWDPVGTPSKCWPPVVQADIGYLQGAVNSLTDLILTCLPASIFFMLQMKLRIKIGLAILLGLSIFAMAASIIKTIKLKSIAERSDYTFNTVSFMNWVVIENTLVIIAASIPLLRPLFNRAKTSTSAYNGHSSNGVKPRGRGSKGFSYVHSQSKSTRLQSSCSEENILSTQNTSANFINMTSSITKTMESENRDVEMGDIISIPRAAKMPNSEVEVGHSIAITREKTFQVSYEDERGRETIDHANDIGVARSHEPND